MSRLQKLLVLKGGKASLLLKRVADEDQLSFQRLPFWTVLLCVSVAVFSRVNANN